MGKGKSKASKKQRKRLQRARQQKKTSRKISQQKNKQKKKEKNVAAAAEAVQVIEPPQPPEIKKLFPKMKHWMIPAVSAAGLLATVYIAGMVYFSDRFQPNTVINGTDVSSMTVADVEQAISERAASYEITLEERGGEAETLTAAQLGYRYVFDGEVQGFVESQKTYAWPVSLWRRREYRFTSGTELSEAKLEESVSELKCFDEDVEEEPADAHLELNGTTYEVVAESQGRKVNREKLTEVLKAAVSAGEESISLEDEGCYETPEVTADDELLNKTADNLNKYTRTRITYKFGEEEEVLDGSTISGWLSYDDEGEVTLDEEKVAEYVEYLAENYDTGGGIPREFTTHDGDTITVEGGTYGWIIDQEAEIPELTELICDGKQRSRTPVYAQTAVSRDNSDLGDDYVEVDMTNQCLWMYIGGEEILTTDIVSGTYTNESRRTPTGTYTIYYKKSPAVLRGADYTSSVTYWMPFNGGIGLHDASWRSSFGGDIYMGDGSHGCINLPTDAAKEIYENIYTGMPVICYY